MRFLLIFLLVSVMTGVTAHDLPWAYRALDCIQPPLGSFIAYCTPPNGGEGFGDYEIGGFAYGLESTALKNARAADVLVMGNSHAQVAMSTPEFKHYFQQRKINYFLLGFGMYSGSGIALDIAKKQKLHPKLLIINADPFFFRRNAEKEAEVLRGSLLTRYEYYKRRLFEQSQRPFCHLLPVLCQPTDRTILRSGITGAWTYKDTLWYSQYTQPLVESLKSNNLDGTGDVARAFMKEIGMDPKCVIITAVPSSFVDSAGMARQISRDLNSPLFVPELNNARSYDGDHLTLEDAGRWSSAFLAMSGSTIDQCLQL